MRRSSLAARLAAMLGLLLVFGFGPLTAIAQDSTPAAPAEAPTATPPPTPVVVTANAATPAPESTAEAAQPAEPAPTAQTSVVTMVLWYANSADADILELYPLATDAGFVASQGAGAAVGTVDFPEDGSPPFVTVGETTFTTYPRADGVIERWTWLDDFEGARPATLVMQLSGQGGAYQDYYGTATMMSRDEGGAGGVLILALRPPSPEAQAEQASTEAEAPVDEAAVVEEAPAEEAVIVDEVPAEEVIVEEAPVDEVILEEAPAEEPQG
ncbi:MAG: hypothetical protein KC442_10110 [Thermomicrobiales bacterium]|nr:hypothetical protein [Thermomicrobiales bacterium]